MSLTVEALENGDIESWLFAYIHGQPCADPSAVETARLALYNLRFTIQSRAARVQECMRALAELSGAAGLMLAEIDTCGHEVDPAYRTTLYEAWEKSKPLIAATPQPPKDAGAVPVPFVVADEKVPGGCRFLLDGDTVNGADVGGGGKWLVSSDWIDAYGDAREAAGRADAAPTGTDGGRSAFQMVEEQEGGSAEPAARAQVAVGDAIAHIDKDGGSWEIIGIPKAIYRIPDGHHRLYLSTSPAPAGSGDAEALHPSTLKWLENEIEDAHGIADDTDPDDQKRIIHLERMQKFARRLAGGDHA